MANGTYGIKRPAYVTQDDIDVFYHYRPSRATDSEEFTGFKKLSSNIINTCDGEANDNVTKTLPGMYDLRLPIEEFSAAGIYTIYIKPKELYTNILDVSTLAAYPNIRGVVLNSSTISGEDSSIFNNGGLVGYRIEYFDDNGTRTQDYRLITSSNRCEPVAQNLNDSMQKGIRYRFNDSSNLIFCTLTPSTSMSFKSSSLPYIGMTNQKIALINTKFNPVSIEVEMTEHDIETISTMIEGDQLRNLDHGLITTFDKDGKIYSQSNYGNMVNKKTGLNVTFKINNEDNIIFSEESKMAEVKNNL